MVEEASWEHCDRHSTYKLQRCEKEGIMFNFVISSAWWESGFGRVGNSYESDLIVGGQKFFIDSLGGANTNVPLYTSLMAYREYF